MDCCKAFAILFVCVIVYEIYRHMYPTIGPRKWWDGVCKSIAMHKERNAKHKVKNTLKVSAGFVREGLTALFAILVALWILGYVFGICNIQDFTNLVIGKIHDNLIVKYPLITTIMGAFIALLCDYFIIHPKIYVSPNAFSMKEMCKKKDGKGEEEKEVLKWYIENRSLFDCVDIHVNAYKCVCNNTKGDISMKKIDLRVSDISEMAGRWASNNDKSITVTAEDMKKADLAKDDYDYFEVVVKVTHALSRVTKVITQQYYRADIYNGVMENEKLYSAPNPRARAEILTLKAGVQKRFMYARKFASFSMAAIIAATIVKMVFITDEMITWTSIFNVLLVSASILLILFSFLRVIYKVPVYTNEENENYMYRIVYEKENDKIEQESKTQVSGVPDDNNNKLMMNVFEVIISFGILIAAIVGFHVTEKATHLQTSMDFCSSVYPVLQSHEFINREKFIKQELDNRGCDTCAIDEIENETLRQEIYDYCEYLNGLGIMMQEHMINASVIIPYIGVNTIYIYRKLKPYLDITRQKRALYNSPELTVEENMKIQKAASLYFVHYELLVLEMEKQGEYWTENLQSELDKRKNDTSKK